VSRIFEIGALRLDADVGVVTLDGRPMALGPRAVAVLEVLVEHANEFVPKQRILDGAWPGVVVEEGNLAVQIAAIRRVLAQGGGESRIETLARRGYRIVGPVVEAADRRVDDSTDRRFALPVPLTSFVGRERELLEIRRLLPSKRLVTIAGIGGIGKTRLALQAAAEVVDAYRDGVRLVEFASVSDSSLVPASVAHALGVEQRTGRSPVESICAYLKPRQLLLILDNCEHLLDACAHLVDTVLSVAGEATILATSREPLRVGSEQIYLLPPLSLPDRGPSDPGAMRRSEAVQLFVERARQRRNDFALTPDRAPAVAEYAFTRRHPLALELAAARVGPFRLSRSTRVWRALGLLTGGSRTALPRQQRCVRRSIGATICWVRTSVSCCAGSRSFPAALPSKAASAVASDAGIDAFAIIDLLSQLVARSLVIADTTTGGRASVCWRPPARTRRRSSTKWEKRMLASACMQCISPRCSSALSPIGWRCRTPRCTHPTIPN
jgi:non-specific serine/threonine protein kinase